MIAEPSALFLRTLVLHIITMLYCLLFHLPHSAALFDAVEHQDMDRAKEILENSSINVNG